MTKNKRTEGNICVYQHIRLDTNKVFYIGIGNNKRPYQTRNRSLWWKNIVNKYNYKIEILYENLSWKDACKIEIELIKHHGRLDNNTGILVNLTNGGDGISGNIRTEETKEKIRNYHTGKIISEETRQKLRNYNLGKIISDDTKRKIGLANLGGKNCNARKVINIITNEIFNSIREAADSINMNKNTLNNQLLGYNKNKTNFRYLNND